MCHDFLQDLRVHDTHGPYVRFAWRGRHSPSFTKLHWKDIYPQSFTELHGRYPTLIHDGVILEEGLMEKLKLSYLMSRLEIRACSSCA
jgi:hypothetical protein